MASDITALDYYPVTGSATPGVCYRCRAPQRVVDPATGAVEKVVSFGVSIEFEGIPWFCESCLVEAARKVGMIYDSEAKATKADVSRHERRERAMKSLAGDTLRNARDALVEVVEALRLDESA